jgi:[ribosomal protein S5]-alanine N-acetyltransferase
VWRLFPAFATGFRPQDLTVEIGRLRLRAPLRSDYEAWTDLRAGSRGFLQPWEPTWPEDDLTRAAFDRRIRRYTDEIRGDLGYPFFLVDREEHRLLGGVTLTHVRRRAAMSATLGYWMGFPHANRGLMSQALPVLCRMAFGPLRLERIEAACLPENAASIRVLEKTGFRREGYARRYLAIAGTRRDHLLFGLLKADLEPE